MLVVGSGLYVGVPGLALVVVAGGEGDALRIEGAVEVGTRVAGIEDTEGSPALVGNEDTCLCSFGY